VNTAPIYAAAEADPAGAASSASAWAEFSAPRDDGEFYRSWLALLCNRIGFISGAMLLLGAKEEHAFAAAAIWPDASRNMQFLAQAAEQALKERRGVVLSPDGAPPGTSVIATHIGYPIEVEGTLHGAVVMAIAAGKHPELQQVLRDVHWASAWLVARIRQTMQHEQEQRIARMALAADLVATALQEPRSTAAALAVVNALGARLGCERVSLGLEHEGSIRVIAISHTATFERKSNLVRLIGDAMDEVLDLDVAIVHPPLAEDELGAIAHQALAREAPAAAICSAPLVSREQTVGVLSLERFHGTPFDAETRELVKTVGLLLGPVITLKQENERGMLLRARDACSTAGVALVGPRHPGVKLIGFVLLALLAFLCLADGNYRVAAKTVIEGAVQRAVVAPFDGYVNESAARAGDLVKKGQVLCRLDDKDLRLEQDKLASEREQASRKYRQALAAADRAAMAVIGAQVNQASAQLSLVEEKLARATLVAPYDGVVVSGDLSQLLGTPVEQGKVLFEVAPLNSYRVILNVDERDISQVAAGQRGTLELPGIPDEAMQFVVKHITPVAIAQDGINYFRVEASIDAPSARLRPGMEGIGKVAAGRHRLIWIWTHSLTDWLRLKLWNWLP
jgi:RND family efflux transporter MFP subunit